MFRQKSHRQVISILGQDFIKISKKNIRNFISKNRQNMYVFVIILCIPHKNKRFGHIRLVN